MPLKLYSWNVNGLRAVLRKHALQDFLSVHQPDILCLQETKAKPGQAETDLPEFTELWHSATRSGYSGTAIFTKTPPLNYFNNFPKDFSSTIQLDSDTYGHPLSEGRIQTAEYPNFFLVNLYTPNSKPDLSRLSLREKFWDPIILEYLKFLETKKPVIACGDFNAAHTEIDLARPKSNTKSAGFTVAERQGITNLISAEFFDSFRTLNPTAIRYTWWSHWGNSRANNVGWRIDYFFLSQSLRPQLIAADIHEQVLGSDHCPVSITMEF
ncbi:MAG: exodeoxyribonuclease III [Candidatus Saccharibacteria bacterium]|nr:exodeoxyribonuclease III [Candidatus Saccharibacteria bacterium]